MTIKYCLPKRRFKKNYGYDSLPHRGIKNRWYGLDQLVKLKIIIGIFKLPFNESS